MALIPVGTLVINQLGDTITFTDTTGAYSATNLTGYGSPNRTDSNNISDFVWTKPDGTSITLRTNISLTQPTQGAVVTLLPKNATTKTFNTTQLGYATDVLYFPDGVYKMSYKIWYRIGGTNMGIMTGSTGKIITLSTGGFTTGFADTRWIKIINSESSSGTEADRYVATITSDTEVILSEALNTTTFADGQDTSVYAGFITNVYVKVINGLLTCFQPKIAKISIAERTCCNTCGASDIDTLMDIFFGIFTVDAQFKVGLYTEANNNITTLNAICAGETCSC